MSETLRPNQEVRRTPAPAPPPVLKLDPTNLAEVLDRLGDPSALSSGLVNVIGLEGVAERFGSRWSLRSDLVYEHVERMLHRHLGGEAVFQRVGEVHYVVVQSGCTRRQAQGLCLRCIREILQHFVGEVRLRDMRLHEVTRVSDNEIVGQKVDLEPDAVQEPEGDDPRSFSLPPDRADDSLDSAVRSSAVAEAASGSRSSVARRPALTDRPSLLQVSQWTPFVASNGDTVRVSCTLEPVIKLANSERIGFRLARQVLGSHGPLSPHELRNLSRADIARVDFASLTRGIDRLRAEAGGEKQLSLIVPVSFATLSNQRTREILVGLLEEARAEVRLGLVCEICELDGVPPSALLTAVSLIKPFCVRVLAFVTERRPAGLQPLKGLGLAGVSMECPTGQGPAEFVAWASEMARAARSAAGALILYRVHAIERGALASLAGVSHATLLANIGPPAEVPRRPSGPA